MICFKSIYSRQLSLCTGGNLLLIFHCTNVHPRRMLAHNNGHTFFCDVMSQSLNTIYNGSFALINFLVLLFSLLSACSAFLLSAATFSLTPSSQSWTSQMATDLNQASSMRRTSRPCSQLSRSGATGSSEITTSGKLIVC